MQTAPVPPRPMQPLRVVVGLILIVAGATFTGQGLGVIGGSSFMHNDPRWGVIGIALVVLGLVIGWTGRRRDVRPR